MTRPTLAIAGSPKLGLAKGDRKRPSRWIGTLPVPMASFSSWLRSAGKSVSLWITVSPRVTLRPLSSDASSTPPALPAVVLVLVLAAGAALELGAGVGRAEAAAGANELAELARMGAMVLGGRFELDCAPTLAQTSK